MKQLENLGRKLQFSDELYYKLQNAISRMQSHPDKELMQQSVYQAYHRGNCPANTKFYHKSEIRFLDVICDDFEKMILDENPIVLYFDDPNDYKSNIGIQHDPIRHYIGIRRWGGNAMIFLYARDQEKSNYIIHYQEKDEECVIFWIWAYFSSNKVNKRENLALSRFKSFGIENIVKRDSSYVYPYNTRSVGEEEWRLTSEEKNLKKLLMYPMGLEEFKMGELNNVSTYDLFKKVGDSGIGLLSVWEGHFKVNAYINGHKINKFDYSLDNGKACVEYGFSLSGSRGSVWSLCESIAMELEHIGLKLRVFASNLDSYYTLYGSVTRGRYEICLTVEYGDYDDVSINMSITVDKSKPEFWSYPNTISSKGNNSKGRMDTTEGLFN